MKSRLFGALFVVLITLISASVADASLITYFPFEGDANDAGGNAVDGTVFGSSLTTAKIGQSYSLNTFKKVTRAVNQRYMDVL